ncbi:sugar diacid recognition domain-containing protein [Peribacillus simplex]|uniref:sugar diacid recognition domain-containing protein n=1 Tax=Peribacillus simplex TaxID=1478 RepID=UPI0038266FEF
MLTQEIAMEIVKQTTNRLNRNINIMDDKGTIIASGNRERIDQLHFGAMEVLKTGKPLIIHEKDIVINGRGSFQELICLLIFKM